MEGIHDEGNLETNFTTAPAKARKISLNEFVVSFNKKMDQQGFDFRLDLNRLEQESNSDLTQKVEGINKDRNESVESLNNLKLFASLMDNMNQLQQSMKNDFERNKIFTESKYEEVIQVATIISDNAKEESIDINTALINNTNIKEVSIINISTNKDVQELKPAKSFVSKSSSIHISNIDFNSYCKIVLSFISVNSSTKDVPSMNDKHLAHANVLISYKKILDWYLGTVT